MTLSELLTMLREGILNDRTDRVSGTSDYLWTDAMLVQYINEAQNQLAIRGLVLRDGSTAAATQVTLVEGQTTYTLHASVIAVISARYADQVADLTRTGHSTLSISRPTTSHWIDPNCYTELPPGPPLAFTTDEEITASGGPHERVTLRVFPAPSATEAGEILQLRVVRKPLAPLALLTPTGVPEIPADHHVEMLDWAAYLALRIVDDDAGAPKRAEEFRAMFEQTVRRARAAAMRKMFAPLEWGFGSGGFSWGR